MLPLLQYVRLKMLAYCASKAALNIEEGAAEIVRVARLSPPLPAKFLDTQGEIPW